MIDRVQRHYCGPVSYADVCTLLQRSDMWSDDAQRYLSRVVENYNHCVAASVSSSFRKCALRILNRSFKNVLMVDHFYVDRVRIFHAIDSYSRYSPAYIVLDATFDSASVAFISIWVTQFWALESVQGKEEFGGRKFRQYPKSHDISFRPVPNVAIIRTDWNSSTA